MKVYKLVASDLDGTLLNSNSEISAENMDAIKRISERGAVFVPSSGRTLSEIPIEIKESPDVRYIIYSNGASVLDKRTGKQILQCIPNIIGREILDVLNNCESHITFRCGGESFVDSGFQSDYYFDYYNVCEAHRVVVKSFALYSDNFRSISYSADNVEVFSAFFRNFNDKIACKKYFEKNPDLRVVEVSEYNIEVVNKKAGKGNALHSLCDMISVESGDTIAVGDSDNDKSMLEAAGLGLAVSNACKELKGIADAVICSNDENALEYIYSHYICF